MRDRYAVISADSHVNPPPTFWREYLPAKFREVAPRVEESDEADYIVFEGERRGVYLVAGLAGKGALRGAVIPAFRPAGAVDGPVMGGDRDLKRSYFDPDFDRFWQTAVELDLPIHMHLGARQPDVRPEYIVVNATMGALAMAE